MCVRIKWGTNLTSMQCAPVAGDWCCAGLARLKRASCLHVSLQVQQVVVSEHWLYQQMSPWCVTLPLNPVGTFIWFMVDIWLVSLHHPTLYVYITQSLLAYTSIHVASSDSTLYGGLLHYKKSLYSHNTTRSVLQNRHFYFLILAIEHMCGQDILISPSHHEFEPNSLHLTIHKLFHFHLPTADTIQTSQETIPFNHIQKCKYFILRQGCISIPHITQHKMQSLLWH